MSTTAAGANKLTNLLYDADGIDDPIIISNGAIADNDGHVAVLIDNTRLGLTEHCTTGPWLILLTGRPKSVVPLESGE